MPSKRFKSHFQFALHKENPQIRLQIPINRIEKFGDRLAWCVYDFRKMFMNCFGDPRSITIIFTLFFMLVTALLFYPSDVWQIIERTLIWIIDHIEWRYVRFGLWLISEITILGLGMRAFGRFSNPELMKFHGLT